MSKTATPEYLTIKQVADRLQVCTKTVRTLIRKLDVPYVLVGRQIRIPSDHLGLFAAKQW